MRLKTNLSNEWAWDDKGGSLYHIRHTKDEMTLANKNNVVWWGDGRCNLCSENPPADILKKAKFINTNDFFGYETGDV